MLKCSQQYLWNVDHRPIDYLNCLNNRNAGCKTLNNVDIIFYTWYQRLPPTASHVWKFFTKAADKKSATCNLYSTTLQLHGGTSNFNPHHRWFPRLTKLIFIGRRWWLLIRKFLVLNKMDAETGTQNTVSILTWCFGKKLCHCVLLTITSIRLTG